MIFTTFSYNFFILPSYQSSSLAVQLALVMLIHPFLLEITEAFIRASSSGNYLKLVKGGMTKEQALRRIFQTHTSAYAVKQVMAIYRRLMLINVRHPSARMMCIAGAAVEETLTRTFIVQIDTFVHSASAFRWRLQLQKPSFVVRLNSLSSLIAEATNFRLTLDQ